MLDFFLRIFDPIAHRERQAERKRKRNAIPPDVDPDALDVVVAAPESAPHDRRCRVCGDSGTGCFCMRCLAETMEVVPRNRR